MTRDQWTPWEVRLRGGWYDIHERRGCVRFRGSDYDRIQLRVVVDGKVKVVATGKQAWSAWMHLCIGALDENSILDKANVTDLSDDGLCDPVAE